MDRNSVYFPFGTEGTRIGGSVAIQKPLGLNTHTHTKFHIHIDTYTHTHLHW